MVFNNTYEDARRKDYRGLEPANQYNVDYSMLGTGRVEPLMRDIRLGMEGAGLYVETVKGECNLGQHEIGFRYDTALTTCDNHVIYKTGVEGDRGPARQEHQLHGEVRRARGQLLPHPLQPAGHRRRRAVFAGDREHGFSPVMEHFLAGQLACMEELGLLLRPQHQLLQAVRADGSFAPTAIAWGLDNRTCALRVVGHGESLRLENRVPGGDVNPYLAVAALIAAGLHGLENELPLEPAFEGNAYTAGRGAGAAHAARRGSDSSEQSDLARKVFGDDVVDHYLPTPRGWSWRRSTLRSPTGSGTVGSSGSDVRGGRRIGVTT